jgi:hypothetical protein
MKLFVTLQVEFEDGRIENDEMARDFLSDIVRKIGEHTVAKNVVGSVCDNNDMTQARKMAVASYLDGNLLSATTADLLKLLPPAS